MKIEVFLGAVNLYQNGGSGSFIKKITVTRSRSIIGHPAYSSSLDANDIALVELPEEAPIENNFIGLVSLPQGSDRTRNLVGLQATVSGFGKYHDSVSKPYSSTVYNLKGKSSDLRNDNAFLYSTTLPIASLARCRSVYRPDIITDKHICLESVDQRSACSG